MKIFTDFLICWKVTREYLVQWAPSESDEESLADEEIYAAIDESRSARTGTGTNRFGSGTNRSSRTGFFASETHRTVGNDVLVRRIQNGENLPTQNTTSVRQPVTLNQTKMNATSGPLTGRFENSYGPAQFDLPPQPRLNGNLIKCSACGRVNNPDARYCDWCGALPGARETWETVPFPLRPSEAPKITKPVATLVQRNSSTQTVGLFYPGGSRIQRESTEILGNLERKNIALSRLGQKI